MALKVPCPVCKKVPPPPCNCWLPPGPPAPPEAPLATEKRQRPDAIRLRRERRSGREVVVIEGLPGDMDVAAWSKTLKELCAAGGTVKGRAIEIQGDHRDSIEAFLRERGFPTKRVGG